jgi:hypothetical protein
MMSDMDISNMPQIHFGKYSLSRLIIGSNTLNAGSHLSRYVNMQMKKYFTTERVLEHLIQCQQLGINAWQSVPGNLNWYRLLQEQGGSMNFITLGCDTEDGPDTLEKTVGAGAIGIAHHGEYTDRYFKDGKMKLVREYCKRVRETGAMVGISTHMPDAMRHILDENWDVDFFMCCVYERHRTREELMKLLGNVPIPVSEVYLEKDPPRMFEVMRQTDKPCLAFKILAAGRLCDKQEMVEQAFKSTFEQIKPNDAVIVGMYPEYEDQATLNAQYVSQYSHLSGKR